MRSRSNFNLPILFLIGVFFICAGITYGSQGKRAAQSLHQPPLFSVQTLPPGQITDTSAVMRGLISPTGDSIYYSFIYGIDSTLSDTTPAAFAGSGLIDVEVTEELLNLLPDTVYSYKVVGYHAGDSLYGDLEVFRTLPEPGPPLPITLGAVDLSDTSAVLTGEVNPKNSPTTVFFVYGSGPVYNKISDSISFPPVDSLIPVSIMIDGLESSTLYHFALFARNDVAAVYGEDSTFATLVENEPPFVRTSAVSNVTDSSVVLHGEVNPKGDSTIYAFEYGVDTLYGEMTDWLPIGEDTVSILVADTLRDLEPIAEYHYRIVAQNSFGISYGQDESFISDSMRIAPEYVILPPGSVGPFSALFKGAVNPNDTKTYCKFEYGPDISYGISSPVFEVSGNVMQSISFQATGLTHSTTYHCRMVVWNSFYTFFSNDISFTTPGLILPPTAFTGGVREVTGSSAIFEGEVFPAGLEGQYYFEYGETENYGFVTPLKEFSAGLDTIGVTDTTTILEPTTTYHYRLIAQNDNGVDAGDDTTFSSLVAPTVETGFATDITSESALLNGSVNPNGVLTDYYFEYGPDQTYGSTSSPEEIGDGTDFEQVSELALDLKPQSYVHFRLVATNEVGSISRGRDRVFITPNSYHLITFDSRPYPGVEVNIQVMGEPDDTVGLTPFYKTYGLGTELILSAPENYLTRDFSHWTVNDDIYSEEPVCTVEVQYDVLIEAKYMDTELQDVWFRQSTGSVENLYAVHFFNPDTGFAVGAKGTILKSMNGGYEWTAEDIDFSGTFFDIDFGGRTGGYIVGAGGVIYKSVTGGQYWNESNSPTNNDLYSVYFTGVDTGWACGLNGTVIATENGSEVWTVQNSGTMEHLNKIYFIDSLSGWIAGDNGTILHTTDGGGNWTQQTAPVQDDLYGIYFLNEHYGWVSGENGAVLRTTDGGQLWKETILPGSVLLRDIYFSNEIRGFTVGSQGKAFVSYDGGISWQELNTSTNSFLRDISVVDKKIWAAGFRGTVLKYVVSDAPVIMAQPYTLDFDSVFVNTAAQSDLVIYNRGGSDLHVTDINLESEYFSLNDTAAVIAANDSFVVPVSFMPDSARPFTAVITLEHNAVGGNAVVNLIGQGAFNYPASVTHNISLNFGDIYNQENYRMVSLPGMVNQRIDDIVSGTYGTDWRAFYDNGTIQDYFIEFDSTALFAFKPGNGFWLISKNGFQPSGTVASVPLSNENTYTIPLQFGWNIISCPFEIPITWGVLKAINNISEEIYDFQGSYASSPSLEPYKGYYFYNATTLTELIVPYHPYSPQSKMRKPHDGVKGVTLTLTIDGAEFPVIETGFLQEASEGYDKYDRYAPPAHFEKARLQLQADGLESGYKKLLKEFRPPVNDGAVFDLELLLSEAEQITISAAGLEHIYPLKAVLFDEASARVYELDYAAAPQLKSDAGTTKLKLVLGTAAYIESFLDANLPDTYELYQNYPNPFNPATTIRFALPRESEVTLSIYSALGELINEPLQEELLGRGIHEIQFDAAGYASGVYFYRIQSSDFTATKKMILMK